MSLKPENRFSSAEEMYLVLTGEVPLEELVFSPDDTSGLDMSFIDRGRPASRERVSRPLRISGGIRQAEEHLDYSADKVIAMAMNTKNKKWLEPLIKILTSDPHDNNKRRAATALGEMRDGRAIEPLIATFGTGEEHLSISTAWALGRIGEPRAAGPLYRIYEEEESKSVKNAVREALIAIGRSRKVSEVVEFLLDLIDNEGDCDINKAFSGNKELYFTSLGTLLIEFLEDRERVNVRFHLAMAYYWKGDLTNALIHFERAHKLNSCYPEILYFIGRVHYDSKRLMEAIKYYEKALTMDDCYGEAQGALIDAYYELAAEDARRGMDEELDHYRRIISDFPEHSETVFIEGLLAMKERDKNRAIRKFTKYTVESPKGARVKEAEGYLEELQRNIILKFAFKIKEIFKKK